MFLLNTRQKFSTKNNGDDFFCQTVCKQLISWWKLESLEKILQARSNKVSARPFCAYLVDDY